jgi:hypothetical protein
MQRRFAASGNSAPGRSKERAFSHADRSRKYHGVRQTVLFDRPFKNIYGTAIAYEVIHKSKEQTSASRKQFQSAFDNIFYGKSVFFEQYLAGRGMAELVKTKSASPISDIFAPTLGNAGFYRKTRMNGGKQH